MGKSLWAFNRETFLIDKQVLCVKSGKRSGRRACQEVLDTSRHYIFSDNSPYKGRAFSDNAFFTFIAQARALKAVYGKITLTAGRYSSDQLLLMNRVDSGCCWSF